MCNQTVREQEIISKVTKILTESLSPKKVILFGSRGKGHAQTGSDFDFAVDADRPEHKKEQRMLEDVDQISGLFHVDIVYLNDVDEEFKKIIIETGKVVYENRT